VAYADCSDKRITFGTCPRGKDGNQIGVKFGINQRAAQEILGHSDPKITAEVYTDVPALGLAAEIARLPWIEDKKGEVQFGAQKSGASSPPASLDGIMALFIEAVKVNDPEEGFRSVPNYSLRVIAQCG